MRILVLSDSHRDTATLQLAVRYNSDAEAVVFLGDGLDDWSVVMPTVINKQIIAVKGNCDSYLSAYPIKALEMIGGKLVYCTHGHSEHVKFGLETLEQRARNDNADIVLFGHTHEPYTAYKDGLYIMNPGSVRQNSCGIIDVEPNGIMCFTKKIVNEY